MTLIKDGFNKGRYTKKEKSQKERASLESSEDDHERASLTTPYREPMTLTPLTQTLGGFTLYSLNIETSGETNFLHQAHHRNPPFPQPSSSFTHFSSLYPLQPLFYSQATINRLDSQLGLDSPHPIINHHPYSPIVIAISTPTATTNTLPPSSSQSNLHSHPSYHTSLIIPLHSKTKTDKDKSTSSSTSPINHQKPQESNPIKAQQHRGRNRSSSWQRQHHPPSHTHYSHATMDSKIHSPD
ncbi:hypothetical protein LR48_Vigan2425s000100 [Vigna angularis]|uniref:Uncharacterized protein n=2 Tax=Phaseolus angularis TaxID=3914 RepID=A0A8T0JNL8_PHAAN|nr:uncharacterized protein HKW66_Vig0153330 [Vigna angularis]KOM24683.1 hypothetical protein LR48_Vigan2425s000100 [Vigna angularis]BAT99601.1 hypothetical protein VIGAN_10106200 [Vigna angularis var. angularis]